MNRRIVISAVAIVAGLYSAGWFVLADRIDGAITAQLDAQKNHGITITTGAHDKSGFPFAVRIRLHDFAAKTGSGISLTAPALALGVELQNWSDMIATVPDGARFNRGSIMATIGTATGRITFGNDGITDADLTLNGTSITGAIDVSGALTAEAISLHVDTPDAPPADHTQPGGHAIITATGVIVPGEPIPALGNAIKRVTLDAIVMGRLAALDKTSLLAWSNDGGTLEVHELSTDWGPLGLGLGGTVALDQDLQPLASFDAKITGFTPTLDALAETRAIKQSSAALLSVGLGVLAKPEGPDNVPTVSVPITIQNGVIYVSSFKLGHMPKLRLY